MLFERIESERLAHYSYMIGDKNAAVVIDPRRDCGIYVDKATRAGLRITDILETHRNEDYVAGSCELAALTGAEVWHADSELAYNYGSAAKAGQVWKVGALTLEARPSPGHTPGSMAYLLKTPAGDPWVVFTGDALLAGDVGRVDLLGMDKAAELARQLYDTILDRILPLGDGVVVCPAHGAGSVCASSIADRVWTTVGLEKRLNPRLKHTDRDRFVVEVARELERPPYFRRMEQLNVEGPPVLGVLPVPRLLSPAEFAARAGEGIVIDTRSEMAFGAAHVPGSLSIWLEGLPAFAGWFVPYDLPIFLVNETSDADGAVRFLIRLGFDRIEGALGGGLLAWHMAGRLSEATKMLTVQALCRSIDDGESPWILDVRAREELRLEGRIPEAHHIPLTEIAGRMKEVPRDKPVHIFCGSGLRSMVAASLLAREGWRNLAVILGGLVGWNSRKGPVAVA